MSKFISHVRAIQLGERKYSDSRMVSVEFKVSEIRNPYEMHAFKITAECGANMWVPADEKGSLEPRIRAMKSAIIEDVFGEFRKPMQMVEIALMNRDFYEAEELMLALWKQMFEPS